MRQSFHRLSLMKNRLVITSLTGISWRPGTEHDLDFSLSIFSTEQTLICDYQQLRLAQQEQRLQMCLCIRSMMVWSNEHFFMHDHANKTSDDQDYQLILQFFDRTFDITNCVHYLSKNVNLRLLYYFMVHIWREENCREENFHTSKCICYRKMLHKTFSSRRCLIGPLLLANKHFQ